MRKYTHCGRQQAATPPTEQKFETFERYVSNTFIRKYMLRAFCNPVTIKGILKEYSTDGFGADKNSEKNLRCTPF